MNALSIDEAALDVNTQKRRTGYDTKVKAKAAAVATIGEHAREGFEFETFKVDGRWQWRAFDVVKPPTPADLKASGGKKATKADAIAKAADQARHEERGAERAKAEGRLRPGTSLAALAQAITDGTPVPELEIVIPKNDGLDLPEFLKRPKQTEEEKEAVRKKLAKTVGPDRPIKNPPDAKKAKAKAEKAKGNSMAFVIKDALRQGKSDTQALAALLSQFPKCEYKEGDVRWYRRKMEKAGEIKPAAKAKS